MWKINLEEVDKLVWRELTPKGKLPEPRHGHSMGVISHFLIIFGGRTDKHDYLNDVCVFDTEKVEWYIID